MSNMCLVRLFCFVSIMFYVFSYSVVLFNLCKYIYGMTFYLVRVRVRVQGKAVNRR